MIKWCHVLIDAQRIHVDQLGHIRPSNFLACEGKLKVFRVIFYINRIP